MRGNNLEKVFRPSQTSSTLVWGLVLLALIDVPLLGFLFFSLQGSIFVLIIVSIILVLVDGLILSLGFLGKKMTYRLGENDFLVNFGLSKRRIPYSAIRNVQIHNTTLLFRLFGASWPGLHWGLYKTKDVGRVWVYSTRMSGEFVLLELVNGKKIAISPENLKVFVNEMEVHTDSFGSAALTDVEYLETSTKIIYFQVATVIGAFLVFLGYLLWIYPSLPEIIPVHFDLNWTPNRWGHKSELFIIAGVASSFPIINTILALKFGRYGKEMLILLGAIFTASMGLFSVIVYFTQSII